MKKAILVIAIIITILSLNKHEQIMIPKELTQEERELFNKLKEISTYNPRKLAT